MALDLIDNSLEKSTAIVTDVAKSSLKLSAQAVKDIWSVLDAAAEKPAPSKYMGEAAIRAVQGFSGTVEKAVGRATRDGS